MASDGGAETSVTNNNSRPWPNSPAMSNNKNFNRLDFVSIKKFKSTPDDERSYNLKTSVPTFRQNVLSSS